ncbi:hypothetical protein MKK84_27940 [Methylobacterium sp. E-065]|uniref:hypothetical protein n=1 Tax=Methylobacterium sp. E-065 TaxID=2836583 RepID=UPI001FB90E03|nr:hypothetical protein [Methylobacterium sp. E-065]MCJ2021203.1 hypothetical protein [Methylobacterium sp. E-065]
MTHARIPDFSQPVPVRMIVTPGGVESRQAVEPVRLDTTHGRSPRFLGVAGELLAAVVIIGGGMILTGLASLP